jgi:esterase/lipase
VLGSALREKSKFAEDRAAAMKTVDDKLKEQMEEVKRTVSRWRDETVVKRVMQEPEVPVEPSDHLWEKSLEDRDTFVVLTDSNGAGVTADKRSGAW